MFFFSSQKYSTFTKYPKKIIHIQISLKLIKYVECIRHGISNFCIHRLINEEITISPSFAPKHREMRQFPLSDTPGRGWESVFQRDSNIYWGCCPLRNTSPSQTVTGRLVNLKNWRENIFLTTQQQPTNNTVKKIGKGIELTFLQRRYNDDQKSPWKDAWCH